MTYKEIYKNYQHDYKFLRSMLIDHYARLLSPFFTMVFVKFKIIPNVATLLMIISGLIGGCLFCFPNIYLKILGIVFIHIWYIIDLSDGEVARITKKFSKYGTDIDYYAHVINHPVFIFSFALTLIQYGYDFKIVALAAFVWVSLELVHRNHIALLLSHKDEIVNDKNSITFKYLISFFLNQICIVPNSALILPILFLINNFVGFYSFLGIAGCYVVVIGIRLLRRLLFICYK